MIFLDTDIISYYFNADQKIRDKILEMIDHDESINTTIINIYEILKGFRWKNSKRKETQFREFMEDLSIFPIDDMVIDIASNVYANLRKKGITIGDGDILIASVVLRNNGILVSNNGMHYKDIEGLKLINWK